MSAPRCPSFPLILPVCLLLLATIPVHATTLQHTIRPAYARDVTGLFHRLPNVTFDPHCPQLIQHRGFTRRRPFGTIRVSHARILHDGIVCGGDATPKRLRYYSSAVVLAARRNRTAPIPGPRIPPRLLHALNFSRPARRVFRAAVRAEEDFLVGFEARRRICDGAVAFPRSSVSLLLRPRRNELELPNMSPLPTASRYLIMIPRGSRKPCVYSAELRVLEGEEDEDEDDVQAEDDDSKNELEAGRQSSCFPAHAIVTREDGRRVSMRQLQVRDMVQVAPSRFAPVFMFSHRMDGVRTAFRRLTLENGASVEVTPGHYMYASGKLMPARQVRVGDVMPLGNGSHAMVREVRTVLATGLYNAQTTHGDIVVNGVRVSTYTEAIAPAVAHSLLAPLRALFALLRVDASFGALHGRAVPRSLALPGCVGKADCMLLR